MRRELELELICGTYEEFVVGYQLFKYVGTEKKYQFEQTFADHSHTASVRAVACRNDLLASGGADEIVKLYNMRRRTEAGQLMDHQGTITCLEFHGRHHLLSGSEDGRVAVVRVDNWQCEKYLGRHKGGVADLSVHPSGRIALTVGRDRKLITWDLVRGRVAFRTNLGAAGEFVHWSPDGSTYAVGLLGRCDVYSVTSASVVHSLKTSAKINCAAYLTASLLVCGDESGQATVFALSGPDAGRGVSWRAHASRLRAAAAVPRSEHVVWILTAASDGIVSVWEAEVLAGAAEPRLVASYNTTCRLTSVTAHVPPDKRWPPAAEETGASQSTASTTNGGKPTTTAGAGDVDDSAEDRETSDEEQENSHEGSDEAAGEGEDDEQVMNEEEELHDESEEESEEDVPPPPLLPKKRKGPGSAGPVSPAKGGMKRKKSGSQAVVNKCVVNEVDKDGAKKSPGSKKSPASVKKALKKKNKKGQSPARIGKKKQKAKMSPVSKSPVNKKSKKRKSNKAAS